VYLEKLLWECPDVGRVFLVVRGASSGRPDVRPRRDDPSDGRSEEGSRRGEAPASASTSKGASSSSSSQCASLRGWDRPSGWGEDAKATRAPIGDDDDDRAARSATAARRVDDLATSAVFDRLRERHGGDTGLRALLSSKLVAVAGDVGLPRLGLSDADWAAVTDPVAGAQIVVNSAATTAFDERYDEALRTNTWGAARCAEAAAALHRAGRLECLIHVSTAFVNGERLGRTPEATWTTGGSVKREMGRGPPGPSVSGRGGGSGAGATAAPVTGYDGLCPRREARRARDAARSARAALVRAGLGPAAAGGDSSSAAAAATLDPEPLAAALNASMVRLGEGTAKRHGFQDTYVLTKAMGEMLVSEACSAALLETGRVLPCAVVRPSIVESALREPAPGWVEGIRMADPILLAFGKGQVAGFSASTSGLPSGDEGVLDVVPVDAVVNAMLAAARAHAPAVGNDASGNGGLSDAASAVGTHPEAYHVATSVANPLTIRAFVKAATRHFTETPFLDKRGRPVSVSEMRVFPNSEAFLWWAQRTYALPTLARRLRGLLPGGGAGSSAEGGNKVGGGKARRRADRRDQIAERTLDQLRYLSVLYSAYTAYPCRFDSSNTARLHASLDDDDKRSFGIDLGPAGGLDWDTYLADVHLPGLRRYVLKGKGSAPSSKVVAAPATPGGEGSGGSGSSEMSEISESESEGEWA